MDLVGVPEANLICREHPGSFSTKMSGPIFPVIGWVCLGNGSREVRQWIGAAASDPLLALGVGLLVLAGLACFFWPDRGVLSRVEAARQVKKRVLLEDALKHLYQTELAGRRPTMQSLAGALGLRLDRVTGVVEDLQRRHLLDLPGSQMQLTAAGRRYALNVIRAHRLWEQHLAERTGVAEMEWHRRAERQEHFISPAEADFLEAQLGYPAFDPHGDPIPTAQGEIAQTESLSIAAIEPNRWARIVHIEDEPDAVYAQIRAMGLCPGMTVRVLESSSQRIRLLAGGEEHVLAPVTASNIAVVPVQPADAAPPLPDQCLSQLRPGQKATVVRLSPLCRGPERRRLLDLGLLPGTMVVAELHSPSGNATAFRVRGTLIALRKEQSDLIQIEPPEDAVG